MVVFSDNLCAKPVLPVLLKNHPILFFTVLISFNTEIRIQKTVVFLAIQFDMTKLRIIALGIEFEAL